MPLIDLGIAPDIVSGELVDLEPAYEPKPRRGTFTMSALKRDTAAMAKGLDVATADFMGTLHDMSSALYDVSEAAGIHVQDKPTFFKNIQDVFLKRADYCEKVLQEEGADSFDRLFGAAVGGLGPGILEWTAGVPFAAITGGAEAYAKGEDVLKGALVGGVKRYVLGKLLRYYSQIKNPLVRRGLSASTFGGQGVIEGASPEEIASSVIMGAVLAEPAQRKKAEVYAAKVTAKKISPDVEAKLWLIEEPLPITGKPLEGKIKWPTYKKEKGPQLRIIDEPNLELTSEPVTNYIRRVTTKANQLYDILLTKAEAGDAAAWKQLNQLTQNQNLPTYNELLVKVNVGDTKAASQIQDGAYRAFPLPPGVSDHNRMAGFQKAAASKFRIKEPVEPTPTLELIEEPKPEIRKYLFPPPIVKPRPLEPLDISAEKVPLVKLVREPKPPSAGGQAAEVVVASGKKLTSEQIVGASEGKAPDFINKVKNGLYRFDIRHDRIRNILREFDGKERGPLYNSMMRDIKVGVTNEKLGQRVRLENLQQMIPKSGLTNRQWYNPTYTIPGTNLKLAPIDKVEYYLGSLDKAKGLHLRIGNNVSKQQFNQIIREITPQEKAMGDSLLTNVYGYYTPQIVKTYRAVTGKELPLVPNYSRIFVKGDYTPTEIPIDDLLNDVIMRRRGLARSFLKARQTGAVQPIETDALANAVQHMIQAEHYINTAIPCKKTANIINNREFQKAINERTHNQGIPILSEWLEHVTSGRTGSPEENMRWTGRTLNMLRRHQIISALGLNVLTMLKTPISTFTAVAENPKMGMRIFTELTKQVNPKYYSRLKKMVFEKSPEIAVRTFDRDLFEISRRNDVKHLMRKHTLSKIATAHIAEVDMRARVATWKGAYDYALSRMGEKAAIDYANKIVEKSHNAADIVDLPSFFRGGPMEKLITTFQNEVNQLGQYWKYDIYKDWKAGRINNQLAGYRIMTSALLPALIMGLITRGRLWEKWTEPVADVAGFAISPIYLFGNIVNDLLHGYNSDPLSIGFGVLEDIGKAVTIKEPIKKLEYGAIAAGKIAGVPIVQPRRTLKGIIALSTDEDAKLRQLIWSEYQLKETEEQLPGRRLRRRRR